MLSLHSLDKFRDLGLLAQRLTIGGAFAWFGWQKLLGGPALWTKVGSAMSNFGVEGGHEYWGLAATLVELLGGVCLAVGLFTRLSGLALAGVMVVAVCHNALALDPANMMTVQSLAFSAVMLGATLALGLLGAGRISLEGASTAGSGKSRPADKAKDRG